MVRWLKYFIADFIIAALVAATILVLAITWLPSLNEPEGQTNPQQSGQSSNSREGLVSREGLIGLSNFGLLLVTAALAVATISLARSTKVAADAARDAADAARDAADIAQVQLNPVLWPRIVETVIGVGPERDSDGKLLTKALNSRRGLRLSLRTWEEVMPFWKVYNSLSGSLTKPRRKPLLRLRFLITESCNEVASRNHSTPNQ